MPLAFSLGIGGGLGAAFGGAVTDRFSKKDKRAIFTLPAVAHFIATPMLCIAIWAPSSLATFIALFPFYVLSTAVTGPYFSLVQNLAPIHMRAFAAAVFFFVLNAFGFGLGPLFVGMLSDLLTPSMGEALGLQWALTALLPIYVASSCVMLLGRSHIIHDLEGVTPQP